MCQPTVVVFVSFSSCMSIARSVGGEFALMVSKEADVTKFHLF